MNVITLTPYERFPSSSFTPVIVDGYIVQREPLPGTPHTRYRIMHEGLQIGVQISFPSGEDCRSAARQTRHNARRRDGNDAPAAAFPEASTLTERIVLVLRGEKMGLGKLAKTLQSNPDIVSPILSRLVERGSVQRRGGAGKYVYQAA